MEKKNNKIFMGVDECLVYNICIRKYPALMKTFFKDFYDLRVRNSKILTGDVSILRFYQKFSDESFNIRKKYSDLSILADKHDTNDIERAWNEVSYYGNFSHDNFDFMIKYDQVLLLLAKNYINNTSVLENLFFDSTYGYSINNFIGYTNYVLDNIDNIDNIDAVLTRLSELGIGLVTLNPTEVIEGKFVTDFNYKYGKSNRSMGVRTQFLLADGNIGDITQTDEEYSYTTHDANYLLEMIIRPVNTMNFDLSLNTGYYDEEMIATGYYNGKNHVSTNLCKEYSSNIKLETGIIVNNLLFDSNNLPKKISLDETIFKMFPKLKQQLAYNRKLVECNQFINMIRDYIAIHGIMSDSNKELKEIDAKCGNELEKAYFELSFLMESSSMKAHEIYEGLAESNDNELKLKF